MQVYRIGPEGIKQLKRRILFRLLPLLIIGGGIGFLVTNATSSGKESSSFMLRYFLPIYGLTIIFSLIRTLNKQHNLLKSFTLTFSDSRISRIQLNTPEISIDFGDIKEIGTTRNGSLLVKGTNKNDLICIPSYIDGYAEIHQRLQQIHPIVKNSHLLFWPKVLAVISILSLGLLLCVLLIDSKWVVALCGSVFIAIKAMHNYSILGSKNVDSRAKQNAILNMLVILVVLVLMVNKLNTV